MKDIMKKLWRGFVFACLPFALLLAAGYLFHRNNPGTLLPDGAVRPVGIVLLLVSVVMNVALPIILRVRFHDAAVKAGSLELEGYLGQQRRQMILVGIGGAFAGAAYLLVVPPLYLYGSVLSALYGIYAILPNDRKTAGELKAYGLGSLVSRSSGSEPGGE